MWSVSQIWSPSRRLSRARSTREENRMAFVKPSRCGELDVESGLLHVNNMVRLSELAFVARRNMVTVEKHLTAAGVTLERRPHVSSCYGRWVGLSVARAYIQEHGRPEPKEDHDDR